VSRRDDLLETAVELFASFGFQATSIDRILSVSGVSKPTLYRYFDSKDDLIIAALNLWDLTWRTALMDAMRRGGDRPRDRLLALFDALQGWFETPDFKGSLFINATVEFPEHDNRIKLAAREHKRALATQVRDVVALSGAENPGELTAELTLLMEGAIIVAQAADDREAGRRARTIAQALLDQAGIGG